MTLGYFPKVKSTPLEGHPKDILENMIQALGVWNRLPASPGDWVGGDTSHPVELVLACLFSSQSPRWVAHLML